MNDSLHWMERALQIAKRGRFAVSPNPMVGACVVKANRLIAEGYHHAYGFPHAEIEALRKAGAKSKGADLYVSLEPCSSWGKTPPCTEAILASGIRRVFVASVDPNPLHQGKGIQILRKSGVKVHAGILDKESRALNQSFEKYIRTGLPFVTLKMAQSLDGKIATAAGESRWISSSDARVWVHRLRAEQDAILIGTNTANHDNPSLLSKIKKSDLRKDGKPWRVVLDASAKISRKAKIFEGENLTLRVVSLNTLSRLKDRLPGGHFGWIAVPEKKRKIDLKALLQELGQLGVSKLLVEGGAELAWSLLSQGLVDQLYWIVAPKIIGGRNAKSSVTGEGIRKLTDAMPLEFTEVSALGPDLLIHAVRKRD